MMMLKLAWRFCIGPLTSPLKQPNYSPRSLLFRQYDQRALTLLKVGAGMYILRL